MTIVDEIMQDIHTDGVHLRGDDSSLLSYDELKQILTKHLTKEEEVEISKKELKEHCIGDEYGVVYGLVCLLLLSKGIKLVE